MSSFFLYIGHRLAAVFTTLLVVSILVFVVIDLPPGDFASAKIAEMAAMGQDVDPKHRFNYLLHELVSKIDFHQT